MFSFGSNFLNFPNGLIIQWGTGIAPNGNDLVRFHKPFKTMNYQIFATDNGPGTHIIGTVLDTTATFRIYGTNPTELKYKSTGFRWLAIGY